MGHFDGRLARAVQTAAEHTRGKEGAFYSILNNYNFYDIDDPNNGLTDWQRAGVPEANQRRMSALCNAITDMFVDFLSNDDYGVMTTVLSDVINKLDQRGAQTAGEMDAVGGILGGLTGGASEAARQALSAAIAAAMNGNKFDPDILPPISIGINGLPVSIANFYKPGFTQPNWPFLYEHEVRKEPGFFDDGGRLMLGPSIPMDLGGKARILVLKAIFAVPDVDDHGNPVGDMEGGISEEDFELIKGAMEKSYSELSDKEKAFTLTAEQSRASYFRYINLVLWGAICNKNNWAYLHWGVLSHNSMPEPVKTAVCSFLRTNGLALDADINAPAAMISYCLNIGMAYHIGRQNPVTIVGIEGQHLIAIADPNSKEVVEVTNYDKAVRFDGGVPKNPALAKLHFGFIADILIRLTNASSEYDTELRQRRVDEANLIYNYCGYPQVTYGMSPASVPLDVRADAIERRGFLDLMKSTVYVFHNDSGNYGAGANVKIVLQSSKIDPDGTILQERSKQVLKYLGGQIGVDTIEIGSLYRSPEDQGKAMANNWHNGRRINYNGGFPINKVYIDWAATHDGVPTYPTTGKKAARGDNGLKVSEADFPTVKKLMQEESARLTKNGITVSNHTTDYTKYQAIDIGGLKKWSRQQCDRALVVLRDAKARGIIQKWITPNGWGDPPAHTGEECLHIEVATNSTAQIPMAVEDPSVLSPDPASDVAIVVTNENLINKASLDVVFTKDNVDKKNLG